MILLHSKIILVCSASESKSAAQTGLPQLRFGLGLTSNGTLSRTIAQTHSAKDILCLSDFGITAPVLPDTIRQLMEEAKTYSGIFVDIERKNIYIDEFMRSLGDSCKAADLPLFIPISHHAYASDAWVLAPGAASGGNLQEELERGMSYFNGHLAVSLQPVCRRFYLPSDDPDGESLTGEELSAALLKTGAHSFFSRELCLNYFTYMDNTTGVFVIYDTEETLRMRLDLMQKIGIPYIFAEWNGCEKILGSSGGNIGGFGAD